MSSAGGRRGREPRSGGRVRRHAVDAIRAPIVARRVVGEQVPAPAPVDEAVRFDDAPAALVALVGAVVEAEDLTVAARGRDQGEDVRVDRRWRIVGADLDHRVAQRVGSAPQRRRHHLLQLGEGTFRVLLHARDAPGLRRQEARGDRDDVGIVEQHRRHPRAGREPVAAGRAADAVDAVAEHSQPSDVVAHGTRGHTQPVGELGAVPCPQHLEQREQIEEALGRSGHQLRMPAQ